jgi:hypothetical protein
LPVTSIPQLQMPMPTQHGKTAKRDEQALITTFHHNGVFSLFLGGAVLYQQQAHKRMHVKGIGQVEIDDIDAGIDKDGTKIIVPKGVKIAITGANDGKFNWPQIKQDFAACEQLQPGIDIRPIGALALPDRFVLMEFAVVENDISVVNEKHYAWS